MPDIIIICRLPEENLKSYKDHTHTHTHMPDIFVPAGPIIMTSNCLTEPQKSYKDHVFTFGAVGWPNIKHLGDNAEKINWDGVIAQAKASKGFSEGDTKFSFDVTSPLGQASPAKPLMVGFGHDAVLGAAGTVLKVILHKLVSVLLACNHLLLVFVLVMIQCAST
jgi:hydroxylamine reductase (hybrid-cluster protein)